MQPSPQRGKKNEKSIQNYSSDSEAPQFPPAHPKLATTPI